MLPRATLIAVVTVLPPPVTVAQMQSGTASRPRRPLDLRDVGPLVAGGREAAAEGSGASVTRSAAPRDDSPGRRPRPRARARTSSKTRTSPGREIQPAVERGARRPRGQAAVAVAPGIESSRLCSAKALRACSVSKTSGSAPPRARAWSWSRRGGVEPAQELACRRAPGRCRQRPPSAGTLAPTCTCTQARALQPSCMR